MDPFPKGNNPLRVVPTGSRQLDRALGTGGLPIGHTVEIFGEPASGKTTLALHTIAQIQSRGGSAAFLDTEHAFDTPFASRIGVNLDELLFSQPDHGEQAIEIAEHLIRTGAVDVLVIDSVASLISREELAASMGSLVSSSQSRLMSNALARLSGFLYRTQTLLLFCNQIRTRLDSVHPGAVATPGGRALNMHATMRIEIQRLGRIEHEGQVVGQRVRARIVKNRLAPPFETVEFDIYFDRGICPISDLIDAAIHQGFVQHKRGSWLLEDRPLGISRQESIQSLLDQPAIRQSLEHKINDLHPSQPQRPNPPSHRQ